MFNKHFLIILSLTFIVFTAVSCEKLMPEIPKEEDVLDGPTEGLNTAELAQFLKGDAAFNEVFTAQTGLGSVFVSTNCASCHAKDGKGHPFTTLIRFGQTDSTGNKYLHLGGPQIQNRALPGYKPEQLPLGASFSKFTPPAVTGLGFLSAISDADIISMSDPVDIDGDGISGVPNWISIPSYVIPDENAITQNGKYIGRFGKKAAVYSLLQQTINAYNQDMGVTSIFNPFDVYTGLEIDPEVSTQTVQNLVFYMQTLKAPIQRNQENERVIKGKKLFVDINCSNCHKPTLTTSYSSISAISNKTIHPYTDLLLHDMGTNLDDGYTEGNAKTNEWRTPPLWGLGLSINSQGGQYFLMHDGRAKSIEEAILLHGGEALNSKINFQNLTSEEKDALLIFLKSL